MFKKIKIDFLIIYTVALSIFVPLKFVLFPNLFGEDEVLTYLINVEIINSLKDLDVKSIFIHLLKDWHPPGRNVLPVIPLMIFSEEIYVARFVYLIFWVLSALLAVQISKKISNKFSGFVCVSLIFGSGLYHIQILSFGIVLVTFFGLVIIWLLLNKGHENLINDKLYINLMIVCFIAFLFFNTFLLILIGINFLVIYQILFLKKNNNFALKKYITLASFFAFLYIIYYCIFIVMPFLITNSPSFINLLTYLFGELNFGNWDGKPFGQYYQYIHRSETSEFNYLPLINNLKYLNWHFFPFLGPLILILGIFMMLKEYKNIFFIFLPFLVIMNFYIQGRSMAHFVSYVIWSIPFFSLIFQNKLFERFISRILVIIFISIVFSFSYLFHIKTYDENTYRYDLVKKLFGLYIWPSNIKRPLVEISNLVKEISNLNDRMIYSIDGSLVKYYLKDYNFKKINIDNMSKIGNTEEFKKFKDIKIYITDNSKIKPCQNIILKKHSFSGSNIVVYQFN